MLAFSNARHDDQGETLVHAALDATGRPSINPLKLGVAVDDAKLTQPAFWP